MYHTLAQLRDIEARALGDGLPLMQRAGLAAADFITARFGRAAPILALVGPGNNGGDALVAATRLRERGYTVSVLMPAGAGKLPADAAQALQAWRDAGGSETTTLPALPSTVILDGLFGIGLNRPLSGDWQTLINTVNALGKPILALDVPSGINADSGASMGAAIKARWTLSFIGQARGLFTGEACDATGEMHLSTLGLGDEQRPAGAIASTAGIAQATALLRPSNSHKGRFGTLAIVGGAAGMVGAALLAGRAALHAGAGKVQLALLDEQGPRIDFARPELMLRAFDTDLLAAASAVVLGPGLGNSEQAAKVLNAALGIDAPLLLDADALNLVANNPEFARRIGERKHLTVLTPHPSEAARLLGVGTSSIQAQRFVAAEKLAARFNACVVLKGAGSLVASPTQMAINRTGSAALANAGQGDVLSGLIGALLAQGLSGWEAANLGVHAHGLASDRLLLRHGGLATLADTVAVEAGRVLGEHARRALRFW